MAFTTLDSVDLEVGKPIKKQLLENIKDNEDDHELRIDKLEQGVGKIIVADFEVIGYISHYSAVELLGIATHRAPADYNLVEFVVTLLDSANGFSQDVPPVPIVSSAAGVLELDLKKSTDGGVTFTSILTTKPAIPSGINGKGTSSNSTGCVAAVFSNNQIEQDDLLRLDVTSIKDTQGTFAISIYGTLD